MIKGFYKKVGVLLTFSFLYVGSFSMKGVSEEDEEYDNMHLKGHYFDNENKKIDINVKRCIKNFSGFYAPSRKIIGTKVHQTLALNGKKLRCTGKGDLLYDGENFITSEEEIKKEDKDVVNIKKIELEYTDKEKKILQYYDKNGKKVKESPVEEEFVSFNEIINAEHKNSRFFLPKTEILKKKDYKFEVCILGDANDKQLFDLNGNIIEYEECEGLLSKEANKKVIKKKGTMNILCNLNGGILQIGKPVVPNKDELLISSGDVVSNIFYDIQGKENPMPSVPIMVQELQYQKKQGEDSESKLKKATEELKQTNNEKTELQNTNADLLKQVGNLNNEKENLAKKNNAVEAEINQLNNELNKVKETVKMLDALKLEVEKAKKERNDINVRLKKKDESYNDLVKKNNELVNAKNEIKQKFDNLGKEYKYLENKTVNLESEKNILENEKKNIENKNINLVNEKNELLNNCNNLEDEKNEIENEYNKLIDENNNLMNEKNEIKQEFDRLEKEYNELYNNNDKLSNEYDELKQVHKDLELKFNTLEGNFNASEAGKTLQNLEQARREIGDLEKECNSLRLLNEELEQKEKVTDLTNNYLKANNENIDDDDKKNIGNVLGSKEKLDVFQKENKGTLEALDIAKGIEDIVKNKEKEIETTMEQERAGLLTKKGKGVQIKKDGDDNSAEKSTLNMIKEINGHMDSYGGEMWTKIKKDERASDIENNLNKYYNRRRNEKNFKELLKAKGTEMKENKIDNKSESIVPDDKNSNVLDDKNLKPVLILKDYDGEKKWKKTMKDIRQLNPSDEEINKAFSNIERNRRLSNFTSADLVGIEIAKTLYDRKKIEEITNSNLKNDEELNKYDIKNVLNMGNINNEQLKKLINDTQTNFNNEKSPYGKLKILKKLSDNLSNNAIQTEILKGEHESTDITSQEIEEAKKTITAEEKEAVLMKMEDIDEETRKKIKRSIRPSLKKNIKHSLFTNLHNEFAAEDTTEYLKKFNRDDFNVKNNFFANESDDYLEEQKLEEEKLNKAQELYNKKLTEYTKNKIAAKKLGALAEQINIYINNKTMAAKADFCSSIEGECGGKLPMRVHEKLMERVYNNINIFDEGNEFLSKQEKDSINEEKTSISKAKENLKADLLNGIKKEEGDGDDNSTEQEFELFERNFKNIQKLFGMKNTTQQNLNKKKEEKASEGASRNENSKMSYVRSSFENIKKMITNVSNELKSNNTHVGQDITNSIAAIDGVVNNINIQTEKCACVFINRKLDELKKNYNILVKAKNEISELTNNQDKIRWGIEKKEKEVLGEKNTDKLIKKINNLKAFINDLFINEINENDENSMVNEMESKELLVESSKEIDNKKEIDNRNEIDNKVEEDQLANIINSEQYNLMKNKVISAVNKAKKNKVKVPVEQESADEKPEDTNNEKELIQMQAKAKGEPKVVNEQEENIYLAKKEDLEREKDAISNINNVLNTKDMALLKKSFDKMNKDINNKYDILRVNYPKYFKFDACDIKIEAENEQEKKNKQMMELKKQHYTKELSLLPHLMFMKGMGRLAFSFLTCAINNLMKFEKKNVIGSYYSIYTFSFGKVCQPSFFMKDMYIDLSISLFSFLIFSLFDKFVYNKYSEYCDPSNSVTNRFCFTVTCILNAFNININWFIKKDFYISFNLMSIFDTLSYWYIINKAKYEEELLKKIAGIYGSINADDNTKKEVNKQDKLRNLRFFAYLLNIEYKKYAQKFNKFKRNDDKDEQDDDKDEHNDVGMSEKI